MNPYIAISHSGNRRRVRKSLLTRQVGTGFDLFGTSVVSIGWRTPALDSIPIAWHFNANQPEALALLNYQGFFLQR